MSRTTPITLRGLPCASTIVSACQSSRRMRPSARIARVWIETLVSSDTVRCSASRTGWRPSGCTSCVSLDSSAASSSVLTLSALVLRLRMSSTPGERVRWSVARFHSQLPICAIASACCRISRRCSSSRSERFRSVMSLATIETAVTTPSACNTGDAVLETSITVPRLVRLRVSIGSTVSPARSVLRAGVAVLARRARLRAWLRWRRLRVGRCSRRSVAPRRSR